MTAVHEGVKCVGHQPGTKPAN